MRLAKSQRNNLLILASVLIPLLLYTATVWKVYQSILNENRRAALRTVQTLAQHARNVFETHQLVAERVNDRIKGMSWRDIGASDELQAYLAEIQLDYPQIEAIWLADRFGILRNASHRLPAKPVSIAERDYFQSLRHGKTPWHIGHIIQPLVLDKSNFNVAYRREGNNKGFDGVIVVTALPEYFSKFWKTAAPKPDNTIILMRTDGALLASYPAFPVGTAVLPPDSAHLAAISKKAAFGSYTATDPHDDIQRLYAFHRLEKYGLYIVYGTSRESIMAEWRRHALNYAILFLLATTALVLLARSNRQLLLEMEQRIERRTEQLSSLNNDLAAEIAVRKETEQKLLEAKRLEAIGQIAGGVAHEVRNPLNAILFVTEALFKEPVFTDNPALDEYMVHIRTQVRRLSHLMNDLLELGKPIPPSILRPVALAEFCREAFATLQLSDTVQADRLHLLIDGDTEGLLVLADRTKLQQSLINLLENALQNSPENSAVSLCLSRSVQSDVTGPIALLRIVDAGHGIPEELLPRLFEPFFTNRTGGTGLGLSLVKHYIDSMGGDVQITNNCPAPGCTARIRLPLIEGETS